MASVSFPDQTVFLISSTSSASKLKRILYGLALQLKDSDYAMDPTQAKELAVTLLDLVQRPAQPPSTTSMSESEISRTDGGRKSSLASLALRCVLNLARKNSDSLFSDWLAILGDLPSRPGLLSIARSPRIFGASEAAFALQAAVSLLRAKGVKNFELFPLKSFPVHGFLSNQEVVSWGVREIAELVIGNLGATTFEPPSPNCLDLGPATTAVLPEFCLNSPRLPASLASELILAIDRNLNPFASSAAQLPLLQALALVLPGAETEKISDSLERKFVSFQTVSPALYEALYALIKGGKISDSEVVSLVLKGLEPGGILIAAVKCAGVLGGGALLGRLLEISDLVEDGPLKAEIVEASAKCFARATEISDHQSRQLATLLAAAGRATAARLRAAAGRACADVVARSHQQLAMIDSGISDLLPLWTSLLEDGNVDVASATLRGLMLATSDAETSENVRKFLVATFRPQVRLLAEEISEDPTMRRERVRADAVRSLGIFGDLEISDQRLVHAALEAKMAPTVQAAVWTVEKQAVFFGENPEIRRLVSEIARKCKDETNARRLRLCGHALLRVCEDAALATAVETLLRKFPGAAK